MANKKNRTLWEKVKRYTIVTLVTIGLLLCVAIMWSFSGMFDFPFWKFLMGIITGVIIKHILK